MAKSPSERMVGATGLKLATSAVTGDWSITETVLPDVREAVNTAMEGLVN